jgi:cellulose synthase operon protein B
MFKRISVLSMMLVIGFMFLPVSASAQSITTPTPETTNQEIEGKKVGPNIYSFSELGYVDQIMNGPYDYLRVRFRLPDTWELKSGANIQLHLKTVVTAPDSPNPDELIDASGSTMDIQFNGKWVKTLILNGSGEEFFSIPLPTDSLTSATGQNTLTFYLDAGIDCTFNHQTTIVLLSDSNLELIHDTINPVTSLSLLPAPFYRANALVPKEETMAAPFSSITGPYAVMVTPDNPTSGELQAALTTSAGVGLLTGGKLQIITLPISQLTPEIRNSSNLIFVGIGSGFDILQEVKLPAQWNNSQFLLEGMESDDGLLEEVISPWSTSHVLMVLSGGNEAGIIKAAQALSSGIVRAGDQPNAAIVTDITEGKSIAQVPVDRTLATLGLTTTQLSAIKYNAIDFMEAPFFVPAGQKVAGDAYVDIAFTNSPLLDLNESGLTVLINGISIGGVNYTTESSKGMSVQRLTIPSHVIHSGTNRIVIESNNHPPVYCSDTVSANIWTTVYDQSLLHIPLEAAVHAEVSVSTLQNYADFLTSSPTLDKVGIIVAPGSTAAIEAASKIAFVLGTRLNGELVELQSVYANQVPEEFLLDRDIVFVGKASEIPLIAEIGDKFPAPFDAGSNIAQESIFRVRYKMPEDVNLGYLELLTSPWDPNRMVFAVLGTTDEGIGFSINALTIASLRNQLFGDFAVIQNEQVVSSDSRFGVGTGVISATFVPGTVPVEVPSILAEPQEQAPLPIANQKGWIIPFVLISTLAAIAIVIYMVIKNRRPF